MARDIDYAAKAVRTAIIEKFFRPGDPQELAVVANERTITIAHAGRTAENTRDNLLAAVRKAESFDALWQLLRPRV